MRNGTSHLNFNQDSDVETERSPPDFDEGSAVSFEGLASMLTKYTVSSKVLHRDRQSELRTCEEKGEPRQRVLKILPKIRISDIMKVRRILRGIMKMEYRYPAYILDLFEDDTRVFIVLLPLEGPTIFDIISKNPLFLEEDVRCIVLSIINILLPIQDRPNIVRFSLQPKSLQAWGMNWMDPDEELTESFRRRNNVQIDLLGIVFCTQKTTDPEDYPPEIRSLEYQVGTISLDPPEVLKGGRRRRKSLTWTLGILLYMLCSGGIHPLASDSMAELLRKTQRKDIFADKAVLAGVTQEARTLIKSCLSRSSRKRPSLRKVLSSKWMKGRNLLNQVDLPKNYFSQYDSNENKLLQLKTEFFLNKYGTLFPETGKFEYFNPNIQATVDWNPPLSLSLYGGVSYESMPKCFRECKVESFALGDLKIVMGSCQGWRYSMEDTFAVDTFPDGSVMVAVYDGHSGGEVSRYLKDHLGKAIGSHLEGGLEAEEAMRKSFFEVDDALKFETNFLTLQNYRKEELIREILLVKSFIVSGRRTRFHHAKMRLLFQKALTWGIKLPKLGIKPEWLKAPKVASVSSSHTFPSEKNISEAMKLEAEFTESSKPFVTTAGSTAVCVLIKGDEVLCASAGDSSALAKLRNEIKFISTPSDPRFSEEEERITKAGGRVDIGRLNGELNVSRGFGDFKYKSNKELGPSDQMLTVDPNFTRIKMAQTDEFILIYSDGIFDIANVLCSRVAFLTRLRMPLRSIVKRILRDYSHRKDICDNVTFGIIKRNTKGFRRP